MSHFRRLFRRHMGVPPGALRQDRKIVFTFDFAGFGGSGGTPRQAEIPARKITDIVSVANQVARLSFVRPGGVGYLAVCASLSAASQVSTRHCSCTPTTACCQEM